MTTPGALEIRPAVPADLPALQDLLVRTWHDTYDKLIGMERVTEITSQWHSVEALRPQLDRPGTSFLSAGMEGALVGHLFADAQHPPVLVIARLYVRPGFQRAGIGSRLLAAAVGSFPETELVRLDVLAANRKGIAFYEREGFQPVAEMMDGGLPHMRMEKRV